MFLLHVIYNKTCWNPPKIHPKKSHIITTSRWSFFFWSWFIQNLPRPKAFLSDVLQHMWPRDWSGKLHAWKCAVQTWLGRLKDFVDLLGRETDEKMMTWGFLHYISRWWFFRACLFWPLLGENKYNLTDSYFSDGLKLPTRMICISRHLRVDIDFNIAIFYFLRGVCFQCI